MGSSQTKCESYENNNEWNKSDRREERTMLSLEERPLNHKDEGNLTATMENQNSLSQRQS